ncbi:hypothetical protein ABBQ38_012343 [Trebouxia sp. C0009 RCD-2024]
MSYLTVVWGLILGFFIFQEVPGVWDSCGATVVCATTMLLGWEEKRQGDKQHAQHIYTAVSERR